MVKEGEPLREAPLRQKLRYFNTSGAFGNMVEAIKILRRDSMEIVDLREDVRKQVVDEREGAINNYTNSLELAIYLNLDLKALIRRVEERATLKHGKRKEE